MQLTTASYKGIPAMTPTVVHEFLYKLGTQWAGKGNVVELGCWLGGTTVPLLEGLNKAGFNGDYYCFDRWIANPEQVAKAAEHKVHLHDRQNTLPIFVQNTKNISDNIAQTVYRHKVIKYVPGEIMKTLKHIPNHSIEICLLDAPKSDPVFSYAIKTLSPFWIPGVTILGLLDYYFYKAKTGHKREKLMTPVRFIEQHQDSFEKIAEWPDECACVFFKYVKKLSL